MGYSKGVGGEGQLFPLSEHRSPLSTAKFLVPTRYFTAPAPYISHSPLDANSERATVLRPEIGYKEFSGNEVQLFLLFIIICASKRKMKRRTTVWLWTLQGAQQPQPFAPLEKHFLLKCSPCICSSIGRRMNGSKQRLVLMKLSL